MHPFKFPSAKARTWHNLPAGQLSRRAILLLLPLLLHLTTRTVLPSISVMKDPSPRSCSHRLPLQSFRPTRFRRRKHTMGLLFMISSLSLRDKHIQSPRSALLLLATRLLLAYFLKMSMELWSSIILLWLSYSIPWFAQIATSLPVIQTPVFALFATHSSTLLSFQTSSSTTKLFVAS